MAIVTTKSLGIGSENDPKPVRGIDYAGQPMKPGDSYNGRPEHCASHTPNVSVKRVAKRTVSMSAERRKAFGDRMRAYWAARKAQGT